MLLHILGGDLKIRDVKICYVLLSLWGHDNNLWCCIFSLLICDEDGGKRAVIFLHVC